MDPEFQAIADRINTDNQFLKSSGLQISDITRDRVIARMTAREKDLNVYGMVHGGALFTLADMAAGVCALTSSPNVVTLDSSMNFIRAAKPGPLYAEARSVHAGRSTGVYEVRITDDDGQQIAVALFTMYFFRSSRPHPAGSPETDR